MRSEDSRLTRRRGRWISNKIMEIYVQEVCALSFKSTSSHKEFIVSGVQIFPCMKRVDELQRAKVPEMVWSTLLKDDAVATELDEWRLNGTGWMRHTFGHTWLCVLSSEQNGKRRVS